MAIPFLNGDVLDIGCGPADLISYLRRDQKYIGIELGKDAVNKLKLTYPKYEFFQKNIEIDGLADLNRSFDCILLIAIIEHLANVENVLRESQSLLKTGGRLIITTPTPFGAKVHRIAAQLGLASKWAIKEHKKIYSHEDILQLCRSLGFVIIRYRQFLLGMNQLVVCSKAE